MDDEPELPECKVPATVSPVAFLQFAVSEEQAQRICEQLREEYALATGTDTLTVRFVMDRPAYGDLSEGLQEIADRLPDAGLKRVNLTSTPAYAVTVLLDSDQVTQTLTATQGALDESGSDDLYAQEFEVSQNAGVLIIRQFEEAFEGASDPVEAINIDKIRSNVTSD